MTYLFYFNNCFNSTFFGGLLDEAITLAKDEGNRVVFAYCDGVNESCLFNRFNSKQLCKFCSCCTNKVIKQYDLETISSKCFSNGQNHSFTYKNALELRGIVYEKVNIGLGVISNYITQTRSLDPLIDEEARRYFDSHLEQCAKMTDAFYKMVETINPDVVYTYNPRFEEYRVVFDVCKALGIICQVTEAVKYKGEWRKVIYDNNLPHDIDMRKRRREYCWNHYEMPEEDKIALGHGFYKKRRGGEESGDKKIYVANQIEGYIPDFDNSKRNIAIMNSSEDEFAAVGGEWDKLKLFPTQYDGIVYLLEHAKQNFHFYLRVHPNLSDIKYKFHTDLYELEKKYNNITVIPATSDMSTYTIMEKCEKIITFGSTMGAESAYWGKVSILLGPSYYYYDGFTYNPKSKEELMEMLEKDLQPLYNDELIKFGAYTINNTPLHLPMRNLDCEPIHKRFLGIKYHNSSFIKFFINDSITGLYIAVGRYLLGSGLFNRIRRIPTKEA